LAAFFLEPKGEQTIFNFCSIVQFAKYTEPQKEGVVARTKLEKRSFTILGRKTSIALEPTFWVFLKKEAERKKVGLPLLIEEIVSTRTVDSVASSLRLHVVLWLNSQIP
jgi:predicted DNA-binding ribbon-helix-helix protein